MAMADATEGEYQHAAAAGGRGSELSEETVKKYERLKCLHFMGEYRRCLC